MYKQKSLSFAVQPDYDSFSVPDIITQETIIQTHNTFKHTLSFARAFCNYVAEKCRTNELRKQINVSKKAFDVQIEEKENQLRISFENFSKRLEIEYNTKYQELEIELEKEKDKIDMRMLQDKNDFEAYIRKSEIQKKIFYLANDLCMEITNEIELIHNSEYPGQFTRSKYYIKLCEEQRRLLQQITIILNQLN